MSQDDILQRIIDDQTRPITPIDSDDCQFSDFLYKAMERLKNESNNR